MIDLSAAMNQDSAPPRPSAMRATVAYSLSVTTATTYVIASGFRMQSNSGLRVDCYTRSGKRF
jgi:hypothetical protein